MDNNMLAMNATEVQNHFGKVINAINSSEGVEVIKHGIPLAVIISSQEYKRLQEFEDQYWITCAKEASKEGYASAQESQKMLLSMLEE